MSILEKHGFFTEYYRKIRESITEEQITNFSGIESDLGRIEYIEKLNELKANKVEIKRQFYGKNLTKAKNFKEEANNAFKDKNWIEAIQLYGKSLIFLPAGEDEELAIYFANRSAALYHIEKYDDALRDIAAASGSYPKNMLYKIYERQARCFLAKKEYISALESFKKTVKAVDDCNLPIEKKSKFERDALVMIKMIEKDNKISKKSNQPKKNGKLNSSFLSNSIDFDQSEAEGRFARATKNIQVGDNVLTEKPYVFALLEAYSKTHCQNCMRRTITPVPCSKCTDVIFCSQKCATEGKIFHEYECGLLTILWKSGISINCQLALRIQASKPAAYFLKSQTDFQCELPANELVRVDAEDYRRVYNLTRHEKQRSGSSFFQYAIMANFLTLFLKEAEYFGKHSKIADIHYIESLILRNLQFLQFNTHEIYELHESRSGNAMKTVFIGAGIFPTLVFFNHSCDPGIVKYFSGVTVCVNAIKPIAAGEHISENYGQLYTQESREARQSKLSDLYWFDCACQACLESWPRFEDMSNNVIRFRCDSGQMCRNVIEIPHDCNDFMVKCVACGQFTNILKGLKVMQDVEIMDKSAKRLYQAKDIKAALHKYIDILKIMNEVLAPPFSDYCLCQQNIKDCILHFGNKYIVPK